jgi:NAD(P)-dependent dehydrogenase (short-subunit alcohol dehydrogenase family)
MENRAAAQAMKTLERKVAVVTGGGSGIGRALALGLAREKARVVVADVDEGDAVETVRQMATLGAEGLAIRTDVSDRSQVAALADRVFDRYGATHLLCNNAGVVVHGGLEAATGKIRPLE